MGVLKSSSTRKDRTADAAEHLLDIEAKSTAAIEMLHVGVGGRDVGNELHWNVLLLNDG